MQIEPAHNDWNKHLDDSELSELEALLAAEIATATLLPFRDFVRDAWHIVEPGMEFMPAPHIDAVCDHLEAVSDGRIKRLLINIPPGHGKSLLTAVLWPAWMWLKDPTWRMLCASYGMELAIRDAGRCRMLLESDWYRQTFNPDWTLTKDQNMKSYYRNTRSGERMAASVGGRLTGFRGNCVLIDDPLNAMHAYSEAMRFEANRWLREAVPSRLNDPRTGAIVMIMQRLHHEDPSGYIIEAGGWEHLCLPTLYDPERKFVTSVGTDWRTEEGELLFPDLFTREVIDNLQGEGGMGPLAFAGQHQQIPTPGEGNIFKAYMFCMDEDGKEFWPASKMFSQVIQEAYLSWDTNMTDNKGSDFTAGALHALCEDGFHYLVPLVLKRMNTTDIERAVILQWARWKKRLAELGYAEALKGSLIELGAGTSVEQHTSRLFAHRRLQETEYDAWIQKGLPAGDFPWREPIGWTRDEWLEVMSAPPLISLPFKQPQVVKAVNAQPIVSYCDGRRVRIIDMPDTCGARDWMGQLLAFPMGVKDDAVDSTVTGVKKIMGMDRKGPAVVEQNVWNNLKAKSALMQGGDTAKSAPGAVSS